MASEEQLSFELGPLPLCGDQWPEARGFSRVYGRDPHNQARLVKTLLGYESLITFSHETEVVDAIKTILNSFGHHFPEFLYPVPADQQDRDLGKEDYVPEDRMLWLFKNLMER